MLNLIMQKVKTYVYIHHIESVNLEEAAKVSKPLTKFLK